MIVIILKLLAGFLLLVGGGDYLVKGGVNIAKRFRVSPLIIGMTVVAFGTSAPELLVTLNASIAGNAGIGVGNVIGSNIVNIALILGLTALILPIPVNPNSIYRDWPVMMLASVLFWIAAIDGYISRVEGITGFLAMIGFVLYSIKKERIQPDVSIGQADGLDDAEKQEDKEEWSLGFSILMVIGSCAGLAVGADLLVDSASVIASKFGVSDRIIGVTIVAFGTSLPELMTSLMAAIKKEMDISVGNIIGSNIFNILSVIGLSSIISPITINYPDYFKDFIWMIAVALLLLIVVMPWRLFLKSGQKSIKSIVRFNGGLITRFSGLVMIVVYCVYIYLLF